MNLITATVTEIPGGTFEAHCLTCNSHLGQRDTAPEAQVIADRHRCACPWDINHLHDRTNAEVWGALAGTVNCSTHGDECPGLAALASTTVDGVSR